MKRPSALLLFVAGNQSLIRDVLLSANTFVKKHSQQYHIDESHNHIHSQQVLFYTKEILALYPKCTKNEILISSLGSFLHDIIDPKYVPVNESEAILVQAIETVLPPGYPKNVSHILQDLLPWTSFSKTVHKHPGSNQLGFSLPVAVQGHPFLPCYHIIRQADLLSSYNIKRTLQYRLHKSRYEKPIAEILNETKTLFQQRMWRLISTQPSVFTDPWIIENLAVPLHHQSTSLLHSCPLSTEFRNYTQLLHYFCMDPGHTFGKTLDDLEELYQNAPH